MRRSKGKKEIPNLASLRLGASYSDFGCGFTAVRSDFSPAYRQDSIIEILYRRK
jgi:hypothetical protein